MNELDRHDSIWNDRLQDLLDGEVVASERATTESHLAVCVRCRVQYAQLKRLDAKLVTTLATAPLDTAFDRQLYARIESLDANATERARRRLERELQEDLGHLAQGWRRTLAFLLGGATAGIALAYAFVAWAFIAWPDATGVTNRLAAAAGVGSYQTGTLHVVIAVTIAAAIGAGVSKWLASSVE